MCDIERSNIWVIESQKVQSKRSVKKRYGINNDQKLPELIRNINFQCQEVQQDLNRINLKKIMLRLIKVKLMEMNIKKGNPKGRKAGFTSQEMMDQK